MLWVLWVWGCKPDPGEPGYTDCSPYPGEDGCVVWLCYEAVSYDRAKYWVEYGPEGRLDCDGADCAEMLQEAIGRQCNPEPTCIECCEVCIPDVAQPCGDLCISALATCPEGPGCACYEGEQCP